jgi:predicted Zn-dependent protease
MPAGCDELQALLRGALGSLEADGLAAEGLLMAARESVTRFAGNRIHQNVSEENAVASFRVALGKRVGGARTNGFEAERLAGSARRASEIARVQAEDPDFPGLARSPAAEDRGTKDYDEATAALSPEDRAKAVLPAIERAKAARLEASGALTVSAGEIAVVNSLGTSQHHAATTVQLHVVCRTDAVEGAWTETANAWREIDPDGVASRAVERCLAARDAVRVEPGEWTVVLEPDATAELLDMLAYVGLGGLAFVEGRSFLSGRLGEKLLSEKVTIADDPLAPGGPVRPFDYEGVPKGRLVLVERGVARTPVHDRRTAAKARSMGMEAKSTGHALPEPNTFGPYPLNLVLEPGDSSLDEMIASTEKGLLVSHFHYVNPVDPRRTVITGMTRFGTFLIEQGKVAGPVRSMRFTDSVLDGLSRVESVGRDLKRAGDGDVLAPALKLASWRFVGVTGE